MILALWVCLIAINWITISRRRKEFLENGTPLSDSTHMGLIIIVSIANLFVISECIILCWLYLIDWMQRICFTLIGICVLWLPVRLIFQWWNWKRWILWSACALLGVGGFWASCL